MIKIIDDDLVISRPAIFCDICGTEIEKADDGTGAFRVSDGEVSLIHNRCFRAFDQSLPHLCVISDLPLPMLFIYLERGLNLNREEAEKQVDRILKKYEQNEDE